MKRMFITLGVLGAVVAIAIAGPDEKLKDAQKAHQQKEYAVAERLFSQAAEEASHAKNPKLAAAATEGRVETLKAWIEATTTPQSDRQFACNDLGVHYLDERKYPQALEMFAQVPEPADPYAYLYLANHARAWELNKVPEKAFPLYVKSLTKEPRYSLAAERAVGVIQQMSVGASSADKIKVARTLLDVPKLPVETTRTVTLALLVAWAKDQDAAKQLLPDLIHSLAALRVTPEWFAANEKLRLALVAKSSAELKPLLDELNLVYEGNTFGQQNILLHAETKTAIPGWDNLLRSGTPAFRRDFAQVLKVAGDGFRRRSRDGKLSRDERTSLAKQAIQRYSAAFGLDRSFTEAPVVAVVTLAEHASELDPKGALLDAYAHQLFDEKSALYLQAKTTDDYLNLQSLHLILATISEAQGHYSEGRYGPLSAQFQLRKAIEIEATLRGRADTPPTQASPSLRLRLAEAYVKGDSGKLAAPLYADTANLYVNAGLMRQSRTVTQEFRTLRAKGDLPDTAADSRIARIEKLADEAQRRKKIGLTTTQTTPPAVIFDSSPDRMVFGYGGSFAAWDIKKADSVRQGWPWFGRLLAAAGPSFVCDSGDLVELWANIYADPPHVLATHPGGVRALTVSSDAKVGASVGVKGDLKVYTLTGKEVGKELLSHSGVFAELNGVGLRPGGKEVVVGGKGGVAMLTVEGGKHVWKAETASQVQAVAVNHDGGLVASGHADGKVRIYEGPTGKELPGFQADDRNVRSVVFAPNGSLLATLGDDQAVHLWDVRNGSEVARYGHPKPPVAVAFSPDGRWIAIAFADYTGGGIQVWELPGQ